MLRFILIACLVWLLLAFIQKLRRAEWHGQGQRQQAVTKKMMVQCAYCRVYVPKDDALRNNNNYFCCSNHMEINQE